MVTIRPFDGSPEDAEGLLLVERATFDESPYSPAEVQAMLGGDVQHAWLALAGDEVVGFVAAFVTCGLSGPCWEIDLLAVHPDWSRRGIATRLIRAAADQGKGVAPRARAVVALENEGSAGAFLRAGFRPEPQVHELFIGRFEELDPVPLVTVGVAVRDTVDPARVRAWRPDLPSQADLPPREALVAAPAPGGVSLLVAEQSGGLAEQQGEGYAELIWVQTLLYRGAWIESLAVSTAAARGALVRAAVERAAAAGVDEIGALVPAGRQAFKDALRAAGLRSLGEFRWLVADLPLPGLAVPPLAGNHA
jgi:ribosomal protein S18 acetylase RimI-like enzyme